MRWLFGILLLIGLAAFGGYVFIKGYPYRLYSNWIQGQEWNKYYSISGYTDLWLRPVAVQEIPPYKEDYAQLWKEFPLRSAHVPLPVRHPLFQTIPLIESRGQKKSPSVGMALLNPDGREISRVYTLPLSLVKDYSQGQDLFKLPFVRNRIMKLPLEKLWNDIFSFEITVKSKSLEDMIYDLYLLHLRSQILPKETIKYGLIGEGKALVELVSKDRDYIVELIMTYKGGSIYSYILRTERNSTESRKLRSKFLANISFNPVDPTMANFLYKEFKQLNFARQVDQEGMLYLFSAWTQETTSTDIMKEMIFYLERGRNNKLQLKSLYEFSLKHYGKTFSTKKLFSEHDNPEIALQRKIEIEAIEKAQLAERSKVDTTESVDLTPDEKMNLYLKKAKESGPSEKTEMTIH
ncbi:MAG: hypothetical protein ACLGHN_00555 [Bacteriovoracia bacterium]